MKVKLTRVDRGVALLLDDAMLKQLGLDEQSEVRVEVRDGVLVVIPASRLVDVQAIMREIDGTYAGVFRRLADS